MSDLDLQVVINILQSLYVEAVERGDSVSTGDIDFAISVLHTEMEERRSCKSMNGAIEATSLQFGVFEK